MSHDVLVTRLKAWAACRGRRVWLCIALWDVRGARIDKRVSVMWAGMCLR